MNSLIGRSLVQSLPSPCPDWRWRVWMPNLPTDKLNNILSASGSGNVNQITSFPYANNPGYVTSGGVFVEGINWPFRSIQNTTRFGGGKQWYYPEFYNTSPFNVVFYEDDNLSVATYLRLWRILIIHPNGDYGVPADYKLPVSLSMWGWYDGRNPIYQGTVEGCWPTQPSNFDLSYNNDGRLTVSCAFSTDDNPDFNQ